MDRNDKYLYMGGPLLAGVTVVALSSLAPMALPLGMRGLAVAESISLYGGLAVFGGFVLYEWAFTRFYHISGANFFQPKYSKDPAACTYGRNGCHSQRSHERGNRFGARHDQHLVSTILVNLNAH